MGDFQNIFKQLRIAAGLTQAEMAQKLGISRSTIGMYETGAREPDFETLEMIADYFNVDIDYLIGRTNKTTILPQNTGSWYLNEETARMAQEIFDNPDQKVLFDASKKLTPQKLKLAIEFVKAMEDTNRDG